MIRNLEKANKKLAFKLGLLAIFASSLGLALVPLYDWICEATGLNGKVGVVAKKIDIPISMDYSRQVTVEFMGNVMQGIAWEFKTTQNKIKVHPGEVVTVSYTATNPTNNALDGQAIPSVSPGYAAKYFKKIDCFCYKQQRLGPGETRNMPVTFFVSKDLPQDIRVITLSYAFFPAVKGASTGPTIKKIF